MFVYDVNVVALKKIKDLLLDRDVENKLGNQQTQQ